MLEADDKHQDEQAQQQIGHRAEVGVVVAAAEEVDAHVEQAQANGHDHGAGDHRGEELAQGLDKEAQDALPQSADQAGAHDRAVGVEPRLHIGGDGARGHAGHHAGGDGVIHADKAGAGAHDHGQPGADGADGVELHQSDQAGDQHGILEQGDPQAAVVFHGDAADRHNGQQGGQVAHEHGHDVLQTQGNRLVQGQTAVNVVGRRVGDFFGRLRHNPSFFLSEAGCKTRHDVD